MLFLSTAETRPTWWSMYLWNEVLHSLEMGIIHRQCELISSFQVVLFLAYVVSLQACVSHTEWVPTFCRSHSSLNAPLSICSGILSYVSSRQGVYVPLLVYTLCAMPWITAHLCFPSFGNLYFVWYFESYLNFFLDNLAKISSFYYITLAGDLSLSFVINS